MSAGNVAPARAKLVKEALLVRTDVHLLDMDYEGAVNDIRLALTFIPEGPGADEDKMALGAKLREAQQKLDDYLGGKKDHYFNEQRGFPDGKPPQRDNVKILELPVNIAEQQKEMKCRWLRQQFKQLVRKWHPDKYKGDKKRAARKFKEVTDAKEMLGKEWGC